MPRRCRIDIGVLLCHAHGLTYSNNLLVQLSERGAAVVLCGPNHMPLAWVWPLDGNHIQALRMRHQLEADEPLRKRLWQVLVRAKIVQQGAVLKRFGKEDVEWFEEKMSAKAPGRPVWAAMIKRIEKGDADGIRIIVVRAARDRAAVPNRRSGLK